MLQRKIKPFWNVSSLSVEVEESDGMSGPVIRRTDKLDIERFRFKF